MCRRKKKAGRAALAAAVLALVLAIYIFLVNFLVSAALVPSFMERLKAFETVTEESYALQVQSSDIERNRQNALHGTNVWLQTAARQKISMQSEDGYTLVAEEFPLEVNGMPQPEYSGKKDRAETKEPSRDSENHKWVILLHGYTGWKEELYPFAHWYHREGYRVLAPDLRCQGESDGDFIGMGWTDHFDCMRWIQYILSQDEDAEIVLHGQSMGAATALMTVGDQSLPPNVKAVVSDCAYTDAYSMFREKIGEWFGLPAFPFVDSARFVLKLRGGYDLKDASALNAVKNSKTPTLFIHGKEDAMISVHMAEELYGAAAGKKELLIVEDAGHAQSQDKDPDTYYRNVREFLEETLQDMGY